MKKQLFLSVVLLALSGNIFARMGGAGAGGSGSSTPRRQQPVPAPVPAPANRGGGQPAPAPAPGTAAAAAEGLTPAQAISSAMKALNVTPAEVAAAQPVQAAVNFIQG